MTWPLLLRNSEVRPLSLVSIVKNPPFSFPTNQNKSPSTIDIFPKSTANQQLPSTLSLGTYLDLFGFETDRYTIPCGGGMVNLKKILVPTDLSEYSLAAMEFASTLAVMYTAKLYVLHVTGEAIPLLPSMNGMDIDIDVLKDRVQTDATREVERFVHQRISPDLRPISVIRIGHPAVEIKRFAEEEGIELIVMATHGRTGLSHILIGSIAEKLVRTSNIPVLTVKPHAARSPLITQEEVEDNLHLR
jgi:nucleotide-binding universal stress UspA family protein